MLVSQEERNEQIEELLGKKNQLTLKWVYGMMVSRMTLYFYNQMDDICLLNPHCPSTWSSSFSDFLGSFKQQAY